MPLTCTKLSSEDLELIQESLRAFINSTDSNFDAREKNTRARILHNAIFDLAANNVTFLELLK